MITTNFLYIVDIIKNVISKSVYLSNALEIVSRTFYGYLYC